MRETPYKLHHIRRRSAGGITSASYCSLNAIIKFDGMESPHCVYVENVAVRLAQTLHIPVADGVLTATGEGPAYASLEIASPGISLPNMLESQRAQVAATYPEEVAALMAFDIFIGNMDRMRNIKASTVTPHIQVFKGFDHSHSLLSIEEDPYRSLSRLKSSDLIVKFHPFYGMVSGSHLSAWAGRIAAMDDLYIRECCHFGHQFRAVDAKLQEALAEALVWRKRSLKRIVTRHINHIRPTP